MNVVALAKAPIMSVQRGPKGAVLGRTEGNINGWPLAVVLTEGEIHLAFADRNGPAFTMDLNALVKAAASEIETLIGLQNKGAR